MNRVLRQNLVELQQMKQDVEDGCAREAQAQAAQLAEKAGCVDGISMLRGCKAARCIRACQYPPLRPRSPDTAQN